MINKNGALFVNQYQPIQIEKETLFIFQYDSNQFASVYQVSTQNMRHSFRVPDNSQRTLPECP